MKKLILSLIVFVSAVAFANAQTCVPDTLCITGVARYTNNQPVADTTIDVQIEVSQGFPLGNGSNIMYCELLLNITTNQFGEFTACFGAPVFLCNPFDPMGQVTWENCDLHYRMGWRITGSGTISTIITSRFGTVPYAFASRTAENLVGPMNATDGQILTWNTAQNKWLPTTLSGGGGGSLAAGTGISLSGTNPTTITNSAPDQPINLTAGAGVTVTGTYPNFTISVTGGGGGVPAGTIVAFGGTTVPNGWFLCDGSPKVRAQYVDLFNAITIEWGNGDGTNTFNLPDLRGRFLRGVDGAAGNDPDKTTRTASNAGGNTGNAVGSLQGDEVGGHNHTASSTVGFWAGTTNFFEHQVQTIAGGPVVLSRSSGNGSGNRNVTTTINNSTGSETRPKNVYVNYIIKY